MRRCPSPALAALLLAALAAAACGDPTAPAADTATADTSTGDTSASDTSAPDAAAPDAAAPDAAAPADTFDPGPAPCAEVDTVVAAFAAGVATFTAQDDLAPWPAGAIVFAGSSSIRRWETLSLAYSDYAPIQRGLGGMHLGELARHTRALITRHAPRAVIVYAGTNDLAAGVPPATVLERLRCLRHRLGQDLGWDRPVVFIGVTPNPARWAGWPAAAAFNAAAADLAAADPALTFVDVAPAFLATGSPPSNALFDGDGLHLSPSGYALWDSLIRPAVAAAAAPLPHPAPPTPALPAGARVLVDLGPSNPEDGELTPSPDHLGQHWNNWHALAGGGQVLPGERLAGLVTSTGAPTALSLVIGGGFFVNGRRNGGLLWPDAARLGGLAVGSATGDFFYIEGTDVTGALALRGLDPARRYTLRLFAARDDAQVRITRYTVHGAVTATATLQTSGAGAGANGATTNDDTVVTLSDLRPDPWGQLFLDVAREQGTYAYLAALELVAE